MLVTLPPDSSAMTQRHSDSAGLPTPLPVLFGLHRIRELNRIPCSSRGRTHTWRIDQSSADDIAELSALNLKNTQPASVVNEISESFARHLCCTGEIWNSADRN